MLTTNLDQEPADRPELPLPQDLADFTFREIAREFGNLRNRLAEMESRQEVVEEDCVTMQNEITLQRHTVRQLRAEIRRLEEELGRRDGGPGPSRAGGRDGGSGGQDGGPGPSRAGGRRA